MNNLPVKVLGISEPPSNRKRVQQPHLQPIFQRKHIPKEAVTCGESKQIPERLVARYLAALNRIPVKIFPIHPGDIPEGVDPYRGSPCHCQLGNVYQVLAAKGVDVDKELPWIRPWFLRYQMLDGGLNCDSEAYLVKDGCPSSMVATIAVFEAILLCTLDRAQTRLPKNKV